MTSTEVETVEDLIEYVRSRYGVVVHWREKVRFRERYNEFMKDNPHVDISVLVKAADWGKDTKRRLKTLNGLFFLVSDAFALGALPELDPAFAKTTCLEEGIIEALSIEEDEGWVKRLVASQGPSRARALEEWRQVRGVA